MKKIDRHKIILLSFLVIGLIGILNLTAEYPIRLDDENIQSNINRFYKGQFKIDVKKTMIIEDQLVVLFLLDDHNLGRAFLKQGINQRYKINSIGYSNSKFYKCNIELIGEDKYLILAGRKYETELSQVEARLVAQLQDSPNTGEDTYELEIKKEEEYFIVSLKVEDHLDYGYLPQSLTFYDKDGVDISKKIAELHNK